MTLTSRIRRASFVQSGLIMLMTGANSLLAQAPANRVATLASPPAVGVRPTLALTVSGGVSLGSYQGGATWALIFALRHRTEFDSARAHLPRRLKDALPVPNDYKLDIITGASAGNMNGLFAGLDYCSISASNRPDSSIFFRGWIPIGFQELTSTPVDSADLAIFSRKGFAGLWSHVDTLMAEHRYRSDCDLLVGLAVTKLTPVTLTYANGVDLPLQRFAGLFRLIADSSRLAFALPRAPDLPRTALTDILIPALRIDGRRTDSLSHAGARADVRLPRRAVQEFVEASGAFPLAFAPRLVHYEMPRSIGWHVDSGVTLLCRVASTTDPSCLAPDQGLFVDGGIFDNRPLNLALELAHMADTNAKRTRLADTIVARQQIFDRASKACDLGPAVTGRDSSVIAFAKARYLRADSALQADLRKLVAAKQDTSLASSRDSSGEISTLRLGLSARAEDARAAMDSVTILVRNQGNDQQLAIKKCSDVFVRAWKEYDSTAAARPDLDSRRMFYFVRHEAVRGLDSVRATTHDEPRAGIAAGLHVLTSSYETAQNGEMRLFVNGFSTSESPVHQLALGVNSRNPRLMGEQISHFGAFLAKTFREYDYYAGVYDGLRSSFRELYCRRVDSAVTSAPAAAGECEQRWLRVAIDQRLVVLSPEGLALVEHFFAHEQGRQAPVVPDGPRRTAALVLTSLAEANVLAREDKTKHCARYAVLVENALCNEQLLSVLAEWQRQLDRHGVGGALCDEGPTQDVDACDLLKDARAVYHDRTLQVLSRMQQVENKLENERESSHSVVVSWPLYLERAFNEQFRSCRGRHHLRCVDINPTSSDVLDGIWLSKVAHAVPVSVGGHWSGLSRWAEWRPTVYPVRVFNFSTSASLPLEIIRDTTGWHSSAGLAATIIPPGMPFSSLSYAHSWRFTPDGPKAYHEVTAALFAGIVRVGYRDAVGRPSKLLNRANLTVGMGDVNGISARTARRLCIFLGQLLH